MSARRGRRGVTTADRALALRVRHRRVVLGLTQAALAERLGITAQQVGKYETGENRLATGTLVAIAAALDTTAAALLNGIEQPTAPPTRTDAVRLQELSELARNFGRLDAATRSALGRFVAALARRPATQHPHRRSPQA
jgi:transcriptional regulator with XRE-family HTH domain